jgi:hypothetical protein
MSQRFFTHSRLSIIRLILCIAMLMPTVVPSTHCLL